MGFTVGDFIVERLCEWGVRRIYGYSGDGINGLLGSLNKARNDKSKTTTPPAFIQARHEEMAAFMACAHAKFTGEVGVCMGSSGPGAVHLLNGLYDAKGDHQPVVAIVGQQFRSAIGSHYQQELDLQNLFKDVAGAYVQTVMTPAQVRHVIDRAFRIAKSERTVTAIILPHDIQNEDAVDSPPRKHGMTFSGIGTPCMDIVPCGDDLRRAADILNEGERVAILAGAGALGATHEVIQVAEKLNAGVAKALLGLAAVPDDLPYVTGSIGLLGTRPSYELMTECDTLLMIGSSFPYAEFLPKEGQARGVQIDLKPRMLSLRYPMEMNLVGDSRQTLRALLPYLKQKTDRSWQERIENSCQEWDRTIEGRAMVEGSPLNPQRLFFELSKRLPEDAILCTDTGTSTVWFAQYLKMKRGLMASASGSLASMGNAIPYAIAAKFAFPDRPVFAFVGDGAMEMSGNNELVTLAKYLEEWEDQRFIVLVLNNRDLNFVTWEMRIMEGDTRYKAAQDIPDFPYARYAEMLGFKGIRVESESRVADAWEEALASDRPVVIEAVTDPNIPPLPPHITFEQSVGFASAVLKGDPHALDMSRMSFLEMIQNFK